jgi:hypothetical protein
MKQYEPYEGKEDDLQQICARYLAYMPEIFYCHVPNGGNRNAREAAKFKRMGVRAGIPDLLIFNPSGPYNGLAIELKVKGGKVRPNQKEALERFKALGWLTVVVYSFDQFEDVIEDYFKK